MMLMHSLLRQPQNAFTECSKRVALLIVISAMEGCVAIYTPLPAEGNATIRFDKPNNFGMAVGIATFAGGEACTEVFRFPVDQLKEYWSGGKPFVVKGGREFAFSLGINSIAGASMIGSCKYTASFTPQPNQSYRIEMLVTASECGARVYRKVTDGGSVTEVPEPTQKKREIISTYSEPFCKAL